MNYNEIQREYFPYKNACPQDGKPCLKISCKYWMGEKLCWHVELQNLLSNLLGEDVLNSYIHVKKKDGSWSEGVRHLYVNNPIYDREKFNEPMIFHIGLSFSSQRLAEKVKEHFKFDGWEFESQSQDGGDDTAINKILDGGPDQKDNILKFVQDIYALMPQIIEYAEEVNTCQLCKQVSWALQEYSGKAICGICENKIILENIDKYLPW
jgi:hypothetical protein